MKKIDELKQLFEVRKGKVKEFNFPQNKQKETFLIQYFADSDLAVSASERVFNITKKLAKEYGVEIVWNEYREKFAITPTEVLGIKATDLTVAAKFTNALKKELRKLNVTIEFLGKA